MSILRNTSAHVIPVPSRIDISFKTFLPGTKIPNIDDPKIKFYYQDYNAENQSVMNSGILEFDSKNISLDDFSKCMNIFVKIFEDKYKTLYSMNNAGV